MEKNKLIIIIVVIIAIIASVGYIYISSNTTNTKIEVTSNSTLKNGDNIVFELKDQYRNYLPDQIVEVKILNDAGSATKSTVTTDSVGQASVTLSGMENGNYTVHISYNGTLFHNPAKSISTFNIDDGYSF